MAGGRYNIVQGYIVGIAFAVHIGILGVAVDGGVAGRTADRTDDVLYFDKRRALER